VVKNNIILGFLTKKHQQNIRRYFLYIEKDSNALPVLK